MLINTRARVGVFSIALGAYLPQFPSLVPEFEAQYADFRTRIPDTVELRALVMLGTADENGGPSPRHTERLPLDQTVTWL